ncbi:MAG TPA: hypothetical protein VGN05_09665 [Parvibaculum sp.]|jgi:hypothetical protein
MSSELNPDRSALWRLGDVVAVLFLAIAIAETYFCYGDITYYLENHLFEWSQDLFLYMGAVLFFIASARAHDRVAQLSLLALTMFCLSILFREMDVRGTNLDAYLDYAFQHRWHYAFLGVLWITIFILSLRHLRLSFLFMLRWLLGATGVLMVAGIFFYVMGDVAEKHFLTGDPNISEMIEESMEQFGTLFIGFSGWLTLRRRPR